MKIELHIIQNFAPSCLNRDDTGAPKSCSFGGVSRARISSQCFKRAIREHFEGNAPAGTELSMRTKRVAMLVAARLVERGRPQDDATRVVESAFKEALKVKAKASKDTPGEVLTEYLLFVPEVAVERLADVVDARWDLLAEKKPKLAKEDKSAISDALFDARLTPAIALFGRMVADSPEVNVEAACQVAHVLSTHGSAQDFDFFTAVDDVAQDANETGAGMMGTIGFNAPCMYRYLVVDTDQLGHNLRGGDPDGDVSAVLGATVARFVDSTIRALPNARQNTMAAHNLPSFVMAVVRDGDAPVALTNAFATPVGGRNNGLVDESVARLAREFCDLTTAYGAGGIRKVAWFGVGEVAHSAQALANAIDETRLQQVAGIDALIDAVTDAAAVS